MTSISLVKYSNLKFRFSKTQISEWGLFLSLVVLTLSYNGFSTIPLFCYVMHAYSLPKSLPSAFSF